MSKSPLVEREVLECKVGMVLHLGSDGYDTLLSSVAPWYIGVACSLVHW